MPRIGVLHKCSAFRHRIEARLDDRLALTLLAWMLRSGSERDHYRGWACELPGENHADLCGLTPDDGRRAETFA